MSIATSTKPAFIYFDMGNVLLNFDHDIACRQIGHVADLSADLVSEVVFDSDLQLRYEAGQIDTQQYYEEFCRKTDRRPDLESMVQAASDIFQLNISMIPIITQLVRTGVRMGILSNTCQAHWNFVRHRRYAVVENYFSVYALSYELKSLKPDAEIFERAVQMADVPKEDILFIDDRLENVVGAQDFGLDAIQYKSAIQLACEFRERGLLFNY